MDPWQFFPANQPFLGGQEEGPWLFMDPSRRAPLVGISVTTAVMGGKAMPPLWQYFSRPQ